MSRNSAIISISLIALAATPALCSTLTFRRGENGYSAVSDTYLRILAANEPQGAADRWEWDGDQGSGSGMDNVALIRFDGVFGDGPRQIPPGAQITSATLSYSVLDFGDRGSVRECLIDWHESVSYSDFGAAGGPGVQPQEYGPIIGYAGGSLGGQSVNVTESLVTWSGDPGSNRGWIILPTGSDGTEVGASEQLLAFLRPMLTVVINEGAPPIELVRQPYLQMGTPTSMTIAWRTEMAAAGRVRWGMAPDSLDQFLDDPVESRDHAITITGLTAAARYYYDVGTPDAVLAGGDVEHYFKTAPLPGVPARFTAWIVGDSGTGTFLQTSVRDAMLAVTQDDPPDIYVHVGDMAYNSGTDSEFTNRFFTPYEDILSHTICWPAIGNHEGVNSDSLTQSGPYYEGYVLPTGGEAGGEPSGTEAYYSFDYANVHFISLDSHHSDRSPGSPMLTWLSEDLAATNQDWLIAFWHHPPYSKGSHDSDDVDDSGGRMRDMREYVLPMLEAAGVDLVLAGHSHIYERSFLVHGAYDTPTTAGAHIIDAGSGRPEDGEPYEKPMGEDIQTGAVYVVAGHGGAIVSGAGDHPLMYFSELANGSCIMTVDDNVLSMRNIRADEVVTDTFSIIKTTGRMPGDLDRDGDVDAADAALLVDVLLGEDADPNHVSAADINADGLTDGLDVALFTAFIGRDPGRSGGPA